jgi:hypothetical protein
VSDSQSATDLRQALRAVREDQRGLSDLPLDRAPMMALVGAEFVRPTHVDAALRRPSDVAVLRHDDSRMCVVAHRPRMELPFVLVVVGDEEAGQWRLQAPFRLYAEGEELDAISVDAVEAFALLLERYAIVFEARGRMVRWVPIFRVPRSSSSASLDEDLADVHRAVGLTGERSRWGLTGLRRSEHELAVLWAFWIDLDRYYDEVRAHHRR